MPHATDAASILLEPGDGSGAAGVTRPGCHPGCGPRLALPAPALRCGPRLALRQRPAGRQAPMVKRLSTRPGLGAARPHGDGLGAARPHGDGLGGPPPLSLASMRSPTSLRRPGWPPDGPQIVASARSCQSGNYCWPPRIVASARTEATCNTSQNSQAGLPTPQKQQKTGILFFQAFPGISRI